MASEWDDTENLSVISSYVRMLVCELKHEQYTKADERRRVIFETGRSNGSVEYKYQNISAAMDQLGLPRISGYKPATNFQHSLLSLLINHINESLTVDELQLIRGKAPQTMLYEQDRTNNHRFMELMWSHAFGGSQVAARPSAQSSLHVQGKPAAGVSAATEWFENGINNGSIDRYFLFLVGGPGGGKSAAAARIVENYDLVGEATSLAERSYRYIHNDRCLTVINDATIPEKAEQASLLEDVRVAIRDGDDLLVCANRGVIVDDLGAGPVNMAAPELAVVQWLDTSSLGRPVSSPELDWDFSPVDDGSWGYLRQAELRTSAGQLIHLVAVFLDECSLLEPDPFVSVEGDSIVCSRYSVQPFNVTTSRSDSSAASLFSGVAEITSGVTYDEDDPRMGNLEALRNADVRDKLISILRASEISGNRSYSYRDLWALLVRANVGRLAEQQSITQADRWVKRRLQVARKHSRNDAKAAKRRWKAATDLGDIRFFMSLFIPQNGTGTQTSFDQLGEMVRTVDPAADAPPGDIHKGGERISGWSTVVHESFAVVGETSSPLFWIKSCEGPELGPVISKFDELLDEVFLDATANLSDGDRREAVRWYGRYLLRLYGVAHGIPANYNDIVLWTKAWSSADKGGVLNDEIADGLNMLLLPSRGQQRSNGIDRSIVPTFASRAQTVRGPITKPLLVTELDPVTFTARVQGDRIWITVLRLHDYVGKIRLDLALLRLINTVASSSIGLTEQAADINPRLERIVSSLIRAAASDNRARLRIISGDTSSRVLLGDTSV